MSEDKKDYDPAAFWNDKFGGETYRYGKKPNAFVADILPEVVDEGGRVLFVGDGEGRNGVWAARQGYEVTSLEPSASGISKINRLAAEAGVEVDTICDTMPSEKVEAESYDAVVLVYIHVPKALRPGLHASCVDALDEGGVVVLEAFRPEQRLNRRDSGGPPDVALMYDAPLLQDDFQGLEVELLEEVTTELQEGPGHRGEADVVRLVARKA